MKKILLACGLLIILAAQASIASDSERFFSVGLHGAEALTGNYGFTTSFLLTRHIELTFPFEFYSFSNSWPGSVTIKMATHIAQKHKIKGLPKINMKHLKAGLGLRLFAAPNALDSGFYVQPLLYGGWIQNTDFAGVEFDNRREVISAVTKTLYNKLPVRHYFALTPKINVGYQWILDWGIMAQFALSCSYVYAPGSVSIFDASRRFFSSRVVPRGTKSQLPQNSLQMLQTLGTQMPGLHAGIMLNLGMAF